MNNEQVGKFIKELREEKNLTQEDLANLIPISRQAVSKWERGISLPDTQSLIILGKIFEVEINELLLGERKNASNAAKIEEVPLTILNEKNKISKLSKIFLSITIVIILLFLSYFFFTSFNTVRVYYVNGSSDNFELTDGIFIKTREKVFLNLSDIRSKNGKDIKKIQLNYKDGDKVNTLLTTAKKNMAIQDHIGYNEIFDFKIIDKMINNLYLTVFYEDGSEEIKLNFYQEYVNNHFFLNKDKPIAVNVAKEIDISEIDTLIKKKFKYEEDSYKYEIKNKDEEIHYLYSNGSLLFSVINNKDDTNDKYLYDFAYNVKEYFHVKSEKVVYSAYCIDKCNCHSGECENLEEIPNKFDKYIELITKGN